MKDNLRLACQVALLCMLPFFVGCGEVDGSSSGGGGSYGGGPVGGQGSGWGPISGGLGITPTIPNRPPAGGPTSLVPPNNPATQSGNWFTPSPAQPGPLGPGTPYSPGDDGSGVDGQISWSPLDQGMPRPADPVIV